MRVALAAFVLLAACSSKDGTTISFNSDEGGGNIVAEGSGSRANINIPGFSGSIKLPKFQVKGAQVDLNGVHLYPGSTVTGMNIDAHGEGETDGSVRISFDSPADPATVRDWFAGKLNDADFKVHPNGSGLSGTTENGKPFELELTPLGAGKAHGTIVTS